MRKLFTINSQESAALQMSHGQQSQFFGLVERLAAAFSEEFGNLMLTFGEHQMGGQRLFGSLTTISRTEMTHCERDHFAIPILMATSQNPFEKRSFAKRNPPGLNPLTLDDSSLSFHRSF